MTRPVNKEFDIRGINHLALVCSDMAKTVDFYQGVLGMPLIKTIELPGGMGQHFFFDLGNGDALAFFWFPNAPAAQPGVTNPAGLPMSDKSIVTAHATMNHVAFNVSPEKIDEYHDKLKAKGIKVTRVISHDDSPMGASLDITPTTFVRSIYFADPDGIGLEFAAWTRELPRAGDVKHTPARANDSVSQRVPETVK
jgi:catechol 2,3-dioxygenase-like lactoylglutathione lyase family enzyme